MTRKAPLALAVAALALAAAACSDATGSAEGTPDLAAAFNTTPTGFANTVNTFAGGDSSAWAPNGRHGPGGGRGGHRGGGPHGPGGPGGPGAGLMGGGLGGIFLGEGIGGRHGHRPFGEGVPFANCPFDAASGRLVCAADSRDGLTVQRSAAFADAAGAVQQAFDTVTTDRVNTRTAVTGTRTGRGGRTSQVEHASDRTVTGLARGSAQRTVNGTSAGRETTTGSDSTGSFTAVRVAGDTTINVKIPAPVAGERPPFPVSGTVVRSMRVTVTYAGGSTKSSTRREVVTYDGSATARLVITQDGETRNCTIPLPHGRPTCQ